MRNDKKSSRQRIPETCRAGCVGYHEWRTLEGQDEGTLNKQDGSWPFVVISNLSFAKSLATIIESMWCPREMAQLPGARRLDWHTVIKIMRHGGQKSSL